MEIKGKWDVVQIMGTDEDCNRIWLDEEGYKASPAYDPDDEFYPFSTKFIFNEDGTVGMLMKIPEGVSQSEIDEAVASGTVTIIDGYMLTKDKNPIMWKGEDGKLFANFKEEGDPEDQWRELPVEDGLIEFMTYKLRKAE